MRGDSFHDYALEGDSYGVVMDALNYIFTVIGDAVNGALQVVTDFLNVLIEVVPNPDPFQEMIDSMPDSVAIDWGFALYWIDNFIGVNEAGAAIMTYIAFLAFTAIFAFLYFMVKGIMKL